MTPLALLLVLAAGDGAASADSTPGIAAQMAVSADPAPMGLAETAVVVVVQPDPVLLERMLAMHDWNAAVGVSVLDNTTIWRRMTGQPNPRLLDHAAFQLRLKESQDLQDRLRRPEAIAARRELVDIYTNTVVPNVDQRRMIAGVLQDEVNAAEQDHNARASRAAALVAQRRFPDVPMDPIRHWTEVGDALRSAAGELQHAPLTEVTIVTTKPGNAIADGVRLGFVETTTTRPLMRGEWVISMFDDQSTSFQHLVTVGDAPLTLDVDFDLESRLSWDSVPTLRCPDDATCNDLLKRLAQRTGATYAVGVRLNPRNSNEPAISNYVMADGNVMMRRLNAFADSNLASGSMDMARATRFKLLWVIPGGVGQLVQGRPKTGLVIGGFQLGLAGAHIATAIARANTQRNNDRWDSLRSQQNWLGGVLIGAVVLGVVEAVVYGATHPEDPDADLGARFGPMPWNGQTQQGFAPTDNGGY